MPALQPSCGETFVPTGFARSLSTSLRTRAYTYVHARTHYVHACRGYISHRRSSLYVNCIRNSEYPANFLHTDHSRISAKRTSIPRSLHHKFQRTWCNAHLVEAPASHSGCAKRARSSRQCCDSVLPIHAFSVFSYRLPRRESPGLLVKRIVLNSTINFTVFSKLNLDCCIQRIHIR